MPRDGPINNQANLKIFLHGRRDGFDIFSCHYYSTPWRCCKLQFRLLDFRFYSWHTASMETLEVSKRFENRSPQTKVLVFPNLMPRLGTSALERSKYARGSYSYQINPKRG